MKRYETGVDDRIGFPMSVFWEDESGRWVEYADAMAEIERLRAERPAPGWVAVGDRVAKLEALLRIFADGTDMFPFCASCGNASGHTAECELAELLGLKDTGDLEASE